jgi:transposase
VAHRGSVCDVPKTILADTVPGHGLRCWKLKKAWYRRRNEVERLFRRLKGFRRLFSRFDKLDLVFIAFIYFALVIEALR